MKRYFKIPFINKYIILGDGYKNHPEKEFNNFNEFLDILKEKYSKGVWTEDISTMLDDIRIVYNKTTGEKYNDTAKY